MWSLCFKYRCLYTRSPALCVWLQNGLVNRGFYHLACDSKAFSSNMQTFWGQLSCCRGCRVWQRRRRRWQWEDSQHFCHPPRCRILLRSCCLRPPEEPFSLLLLATHQRRHSHLLTQTWGRKNGFVFFRSFLLFVLSWQLSYELEFAVISKPKREDAGEHSPLFLWFCLACLSASLLLESTGELHLGLVSVL